MLDIDILAKAAMLREHRNRLDIDILAEAAMLREG